ncbi:hypothetical protein EVAR_25243_1 [Eumeta japonica]|uniref:Uncharacterized protein n=1 Tax=Eumeta variegata TaxID=151549 RepID=A0A4C1WGJ0_EUMVA|nr:hypothetical protein EVAR_25243_1 [Eumeta japonica]
MKSVTVIGAGTGGVDTEDFFGLRKCKNLHDERYPVTRPRDRVMWDFYPLKTGQVRVGLAHRGFRTNLQASYLHAFLRKRVLTDGRTDGQTDNKVIL